MITFIKVIAILAVMFAVAFAVGAWIKRADIEVGEREE